MALSCADESMFHEPPIVNSDGENSWPLYFTLSVQNSISFLRYPILHYSTVFVLDGFSKLQLSEHVESKQVSIILFNRWGAVNAFLLQMFFLTMD